MKHLKMLGLAAIASLGLMAFVGAGTALATTLATDAAGTVHYEVGTELQSSLKPQTSTLLETTGGGTIATCTWSVVRSSIEVSNTGAVVGGTIIGLEWGGCSQTTDNVALGRLFVEAFAGTDEGEVMGSGSSVTLGVFGVSCTYGTGGGTTLGTIKGGAAPVLSINAVLARSAGNTILCPASGRWTAEYVVTSPHEVHVIS